MRVGVKEAVLLSRARVVERGRGVHCCSSREAIVGGIGLLELSREGSAVAKCLLVLLLLLLLAIRGVFGEQSR